MTKKIILFSCCLALVLTLGACRRQLTPSEENGNNQEFNVAAAQNQQPSYTPEELKYNYQQKLSSEINAFLQSGNAQRAKDNILELRTPVDYLDLHLNIVLALETVQQGSADNNQQKIQDGRNKIDSLRQQYDWLR